MSHLIEYRLRPVTRYIVTRFEDKDGSTGNSTAHGEFDNEATAYAVGYALAKAEHDRLGWPTYDERMRYPEPPGSRDAQAAAVAFAGQLPTAA
jgi:hypothetical protein